MSTNKLSALVLLHILILYPIIARAQYFGRNKVQYEDFKFQILHTSHFNIYHYPKEADAVRDLGRLSERWYTRHSRMLEDTLRSKNPLIIYANHADFEQTDVISSVSIGTGGVTEGLRNRVVMPFAEANQSTNHVLGHELVHAFQYDIAKKGDVGGIRATSRLPLWFIEGMAEYLSIGPNDTHTAMWLRDAVLNDDVPTIDDLSHTSEYFPYRYGESIWAYIGGRWGDDVISRLYVSSLKKGIKKGFKQTLGIPVDSLSTLWQQAVKSKYADGIKRRTIPDSVGILRLGKSKGTGAMNISPSLSPNGKYVAFISEKNLFSLELFLADARTGKIIRKLTSTDTDPHLNSMRFIKSSGSWSPNGKRFAAVVFAKGDNQIAIIDTKHGGVKRRLSFGEVDAIRNPAWSPDGDKIAFSGSDGGYSDLYLYNMKTDSLRNLTGDKYSDLQPAWSPGGGKLAFVTDRGPQTNFNRLSFGSMKVAIINMESGNIEKIPEFYKAKHINPQFSADGHSLYYISDYGGYSDIYRYDFETGKRYQVTNVSTGISGISEYSPAITVSRNTGRLMATVFDNANYSVYEIGENKRRGKQLVNVSHTLSAGRMPTSGEDGNQIMESYPNEPLLGLPSDTSDFALTDYVPHLHLDYVTGGGGLGVSNQFGAGAAGGVSLSFGDMLKQHQLFATLRLQGKLKDLSGQVGYLNRDHRFFWGGTVSHYSYHTRANGTAKDTIRVEGDETGVVRVNQLDRRIFQDRISAIGLYPFSNTQRLETNIGYTRISYDYSLTKYYLTPVSSSLIDHSEEDLQTPSPLNLVSASLAYVEDNSISAFTGPIKGHRLRFELEPTTGSLSYVTALADYRRYFYLRPFTLAFRALHTGRYLEDSDSDRLTPNFLGYESLVRGYNTASFGPGECTDTPEGNCPEFSRLTGSRIGVANLELRYPLLGAEQLALFRSRTVPTTLTAFFDSGVAWTDNDLPVIKWARRSTDRIPVFSAGISARVNILGYLIAEIYYAFPFQRPGKTGYVGFHISPGW